MARAMIEGFHEGTFMVTHRDGNGSSLETGLVIETAFAVAVNLTEEDSHSVEMDAAAARALLAVVSEAVTGERAE